MSIDDSTVHRIYKCDNEECKAEVAYEQKAFDKWKVKCPFCRKNSLYMDRAVLNISIFIDPAVPKTFGSQSDQNLKQAEREGKLPPKGKKPWWRKDKKKIDYKILKNPARYISDGTV